MTDHTRSLSVCILGGPTLWRLGLQALLTGRPNLTGVTQSPDLFEVIEPPDVFLLDGRWRMTFYPLSWPLFPNLAY